MASFPGPRLSAGNEPTLAQKIVRYLKNKVPRGFRLCIPDGNTVVLKGIILLVAIAYLYTIQVVIFSTRRKPIELYHLQTGYTMQPHSYIIKIQFYPWESGAAGGHNTYTSHTTMVSPPADQK
ncbi:7772_t:CDS:1, partial [Paraglomus occultum]